MGFFVRRMMGDRANSLSHEQLLEVADGAADMTGMPESHAEKDQRVVRARETVKRLEI